MDHIYLEHDPDTGVVSSCLWQVCYRPASGYVTKASDGVQVLQLQTLRGLGNCTSRTIPHFPEDGLTDVLLFVIPIGWSRQGPTPYVCMRTG